MELVMWPTDSSWCSTCHKPMLTNERDELVYGVGPATGSFACPLDDLLYELRETNELLADLPLNTVGRGTLVMQVRSIESEIAEFQRK